MSAGIIATYIIAYQSTWKNSISIYYASKLWDIHTEWQGIIHTKHKMVHSCFTLYNIFGRLKSKICTTIIIINTIYIHLSIPWFPYHFQSSIFKLCVHADTAQTDHKLLNKWKLLEGYNAQTQIKDQKHQKKHPLWTTVSHCFGSQFHIFW